MYKASESWTLLRVLFAISKMPNTRTSLFAYFIKTHIRKTNGYFSVSICKFTHIMCATVCGCVCGKKHLTLTWACTFSPNSSLTLPHARPGRLLGVCVCCLFYGQSNMQTEGSDCVVVAGRGQGSPPPPPYQPLFLSISLLSLSLSLVAIEFHLHNFNVCESKLT